MPVNASNQVDVKPDACLVRNELVRSALISFDVSRHRGYKALLNKSYLRYQNPFLNIDYYEAHCLRLFYSSLETFSIFRIHVSIFSTS